MKKEDKMEPCKCFTCTIERYLEQGLMTKEQCDATIMGYLTGKIEAYEECLDVFKYAGIEPGGITDDTVNGAVARIRCNNSDAHSYLESFKEVVKQPLGTRE